MIDAILRKARESSAVKEAFFAAHAEKIETCARAMAKAFDGGARLYAFGNGGSACDAEHVAVEFMHPIHAKRPALPAVSLSSGTALLTAIGNDDDFALTFVKQLELHARQGDIALGLSTSGQSRNVLRGLAAAKERGMLTVGFAGRDGGKMAELCAHFFRVDCFSIHRIQETHETLLHVLWDAVHLARGEEDVL